MGVTVPFAVRRPPSPRAPLREAAQLERQSGRRQVDVAVDAGVHERARRGSSRPGRLGRRAARDSHIAAAGGRIEDRAIVRDGVVQRRDVEPAEDPRRPRPGVSRVARERSPSRWRHRGGWSLRRRTAGPHRSRPGRAPFPGCAAVQGAEGLLFRRDEQDAPRMGGDGDARGRPACPVAAGRRCDPRSCRCRCSGRRRPPSCDVCREVDQPRRLGVEGDVGDPGPAPAAW